MFVGALYLSVICNDYSKINQLIRMSTYITYLINRLMLLLFQNDVSTTQGEQKGKNESLFSPSLISPIKTNIHQSNKKESSPHTCTQQNNKHTRKTIIITTFFQESDKKVWAMSRWSLTHLPCKRVKQKTLTNSKRRENIENMRRFFVWNQISALRVLIEPPLIHR
jgi:hypothetical protein